MKSGKDIGELFREIQRQQSAKEDFIAPTNQLSVKTRHPELGEIIDEPTAGIVPELDLVVDGQGTFPIQETAHSQLASFTKIPLNYYRRMKDEQPELLANNVNTWMHHSNKRRMVRTMNGRHRAFLSDRYRVIDNLDVVEAMLPVLSEVGMTNSDIVSCEITEKRLYFKALFPKVQDEVKVGQVVQAGVVISNSEVGLGGANIMPLVYTLACKNGQIRQDFGMKKYHVGRLAGEGKDAFKYFKDDTLRADDVAFMKKMRDVIAAAASEAQFKQIVSTLRDATERKVEDPLGAVQAVVKVNSLTEDDSSGIMKHFIEGGDISQYGIAEAVTRHSQDVADYDKATDLERLGGKIIELPKTAWETISTAKAA